MYSVILPGFCSRQGIDHDHVGNDSGDHNSVDHKSVDHDLISRKLTRPLLIVGK